jgi:hypothetical protein
MACDPGAPGPRPFARRFAADPPPLTATGWQQSLEAGTAEVGVLNRGLTTDPFSVSSLAIRQALRFRYASTLMDPTMALRRPGVDTLGSVRSSFLALFSRSRFLTASPRCSRSRSEDPQATGTGATLRA